MSDDKRIALEDCDVVCTPFGLGVCVGDVVWTQFGPGTFAIDAREHQRRFETLVRDHPGEPIICSPFALLPGIRRENRK